MRFTNLVQSITITAALSQTALAEVFDADIKSNVAVYWGQASAGAQEDLAYYCDSDDVDIVILSFLNSYPGTNNVPTLSLPTACTDKYSNGLLNCPDVGANITQCQDNGKKILLALGGQAGNYGFQSDSEAETFADTLWDLFGEGNSTTRPFGDAVIDGFDFDIENKDQTGYVALANKLKEHFSSSDNSFYLSAAPQCVYPDASVSDLMEQVELDFAFIQFYNNECSIDGDFNWDTWADYATNTSPNKDIKLYLGLPGSASGAASGYVDISDVENTIKNISSNANFGGIMLWDVTQAYSNEVDGDNYAKAVKSTLTSNIKSKSSSAPSSSSSSSSPDKSAGMKIITPSNGAQAALLVCLLAMLLI